MPDSGSKKKKANTGEKEHNSKATGDSDEDDWKKCSLDSQIGSEIFHPPKLPFHLIEEGQKESTERKDDKKQPKDSKKVKSNKSADIDVRSTLNSKSTVIVETIKPTAVSPSKPKSPADSPKAANTTPAKGKPTKDSKCANKKKHSKSSTSPQHGSSAVSVKKQSSTKTLPFSAEPKYLVSNPYGHQTSSSDGGVLASVDYFNTTSSFGQTKWSGASAASSDSHSQDDKSVISAGDNVPVTTTTTGKRRKPKTSEKVSKEHKHASITSVSQEKHLKKQKSKIILKQVKSTEVVVVAPEKDRKKSKSPLPTGNLKKVSSDTVAALKKSKVAEDILAALSSPTSTSPKKTVNKGASQSSNNSSSGMFYNFFINPFQGKNFSFLSRR